MTYDSDRGKIPLEPQNVKATAESLSIQDRATAPPEQGSSGLSSFMMMVYTGTLEPPWWSTRRDHYLATNWQKCPLFAGAVYNVAAKLSTIPPIIEPRDPRSKAQRDLAEAYHVSISEGSEFSRGWIEFSMKWLQDRWVADNGAFAEVLGAGRKDGPILGPAVGLANLDSSKCTRTGNPTYPVIYTAASGKRYKLHRSRVVYGSQLPSTKDDMHGVGLCWYSRALGVAQSLVDDLTFKQEKLGKRPWRGILVGKKMDADMVRAAFEYASEASDNAGLSRVSMLPVVANPNAADVGIDLVDLAKMPDGFDWKDDVNIGMYTISMTGGFPVRWMWPATVVGATKADSMLQHMVGSMSGTAYELGTIAVALGGSERGAYHQQGKFLPTTLRMRFDVQDDWIDQNQAETNNVRSQRYERNLGDGSFTIRVTREIMLAKQEITESQFVQMELEDGRTRDGLPLDTLFYGDNQYLQGIDPTDYTIEVVGERAKEAKRASVSREMDDAGRDEAREAVAALDWLLGEAEEAEEPEPAAPQEPAQPAEDMAEQEEDEEEESAEEKALKQGTRATLETEMQKAVQGVFDDFSPEFEEAVEEGREPDYGALTAALAAVLAKFLFRAFMDEMERLGNEYDIPFDPAETAAVASQWAHDFAWQEATRLEGTTKKVVDTVSARVAAETLAMDEIEELLAPAFNANRAALIAITLITVAFSQAFDTNVSFLETLGLRLEEFWVTADDEMVCELICRPLHEQPKVVWSQEFPDGPPAHGRCRCSRRLEIVRV